jgi:predicted Zn-dependent protease
VTGGNTNINGNQAFLGLYRVQSESGNIGVAAAFISFGGHIYQTAGLAPESSFSQYSQTMNTAIRSFRELTDRNLLAVQPDRVKTYRARNGESLRNLTKSMNQTRLKLDDLVLMNRINAGMGQACTAGETISSKRARYSRFYTKSRIEPRHADQPLSIQSNPLFRLQFPISSSG